MFVLRLGTSCSFQFPEAMPPHKKLKTSESSAEKSLVHESAPTDSENEDFGADWREKCVNLHDKYNYALKHNILTDVKLAVGQTSTVFNCHRLILSIGSPVFEAMFFGPLADASESITIPDVDPEGFQHLIRFLYTGKVLFKNESAAFKTYFACDKYCVTDLREHCEKYLCNCRVTPDNVWLFLENSVFLNSQAIKDRCLCMLKAEGLRLAFESPGFLDVQLNTIETLLRMDNLKCSEYIIVENVVRWAEHQSKQENADSFENLLKRLLQQVHFGALTSQEFVTLRNSFKLNKVLSDCDALAILEHLIEPSRYTLPDWCNSKPRQSCQHKTEKALKPDPPKRKRGQVFRNYPTVRHRVSSSSSSSSTSSSSSSSSTSGASDRTLSSDDFF